MRTRTLAPRSKIALARAAIAAGAVILIAAIWIAAVLSAHNLRRHELTDAYTSTDNLAKAFEEHVVRTLDTVDQALLRVKLEYERRGEPLRSEELLAEHRAQDDLIGAIAITDASGNIVAHSLPFKPTNVADRAHFKAVAARDTGNPEIGLPSRGLVTGLWSFPVVRRINKPDGSFAGLVHASLEIAYFEEFYKGLNLGRDGLIALDGLDGVRRAGVRRERTDAGERVKDRTLESQRAGRGESRGSHLAVSPLDGIRRAVSYRTLERYPLIVVVGVSERDALANAVGIARNYYNGAAAFSALILLMALLLMRTARQQGQTERMLSGQRDVLQGIAVGRPLADSLEAICRLAEMEADGMLCSILLLDADGVHVRHGAAPSLPESYVRAVDGEPIGERAGSCGTAAFRREQVVTEDIETDPLWEDYRGLAAQYGLRACWATPICDAQRRVLGTFAMYFREPRRPDQGHLRLIEMATHTAAIAILKQREKDALLESEARLRLAVHASNIGLWDWDIAADHIYYSPEWKSQLGYRQDDIPDRFEEWESRLHPEDRARALLEVKAYLASPVGSHEDEFRLRHKDGSYRWIYSRAQVEADDTGRPRRMLGCHVDITERKRAEEAREALSRRNQSLVAALGEIVYDWRPGTDELSWDGNYTKLLGYSAAEMGSTTESWTSRVHPDDLERVLAEVDQSTRERRNYDLEYRFRHRDGTYAWMHDRGVTFVSPEGTLVRIIGVFVDITERKQAEDRLRELANELRRLSERLIEIEEIERRRINRELHDQIGANLSALTLELELIRKRLPQQSPAEIRERLDDASRLVSEVVQHARNVMADLRPPALDDYGLLAALRAYAEPLSIRIGIPISVGGDEILPRPSAAAETALFRVAQEALNNAAKHARAGRIDVTLMADERRVKLMVADNGIGYDRTGRSPTAEGWGLRTMRERAAALDADFTVESEPGKGTRVTIELTRGGA
jgi:PAS domain S-box-containing protein